MRILNLFFFIAELDGHLTVEYPPSFAHTPMREAWSWDGQPVNLTCLAEGIPNATISWFIVDSPVEITVDPNTPNMRQIGFQSISSLEVCPTFYQFPTHSLQVNICQRL